MFLFSLYIKQKAFSAPSEEVKKAYAVYRLQL